MEPLLRLQRILPGLTPELRRAAQWVERHPVEVSLWSMRKQAQELSVAPATMLRLAKAAGYESYDCFREPFQQALHRNGGTMAARAQNLQGNRASEQQTRDLGEQQEMALESVLRLNPVSALDACAQAILGASKVGFMGLGVSFACAFQMHYAYQLMRGNGVLLNRAVDLFLELEAGLDSGGVLLVISQAPYVKTVVNSVQQAVQRGITVVAITDSVLSPVAQGAEHVLLFDAQTSEQSAASFFHSLVGTVTVAEHLLARIATLGGKTVVQRLAQLESSFRSQGVYWQQDEAVGSAPST
ncbi:MurR/RpiR family transcriptional regulator [Alcaligenes faecalis]|uniref:MurR/RpiR family transcriptional regulator n=1 Tax=Alcaligenes faecalis TaxID=511 RepID=UPI00137BAD11|nr:MurR/RpiR family transcriptional regulator [Alcaligenes faecalis]QHS34767.1 MurR/RpiR family transcriptional regulator [Alcaligenes faecalis]